MTRITLILILLASSQKIIGQPHGTVYFTDASYNKIYKLNGSLAEPVIDQGLGFPWRLAVCGNNLYWTSVDTNLVEKSDLDGKNRRELAVITYPEGISVDQVTGNVYVSEAGTPAIILLIPPSYAPDTLYSDGLVDPDNIIFHPKTNKLYWVDVALGQIIRANSDGSGYSILFEDSGYEPQAIAIDEDAKFIYWADIKQHGIVEFNLLTKQTSLLVKSLKKPTAIAYNKKYHELVWIDSATKSIGWKEVDSTKIHSLKVKEIGDFHSGLIILN